MNEQQPVPPVPTPVPAQPVAPGVQPVNSHMTMSVVSLILSGISIFGILAVVFSSMASSALSAGNVPDATSKANTAKIMAIIAFVWAGLGILSFGFFLLMMIIAAASGSGSSY
ncbi:CD225/dispanin family protein [Candidatus Saccharibacteria bacterium]|nr:MAG: CD225/dispanin family protein [Candidatus Saccharibacteria bacterium]